VFECCAESIDALSTAIKLFPDHPDRSWSELILADALKKIQNDQKATVQLNQLIKSESGDDIMKKAAESQLKMMEWEKEVKGSL
jgi:predicted Zn-dependent protease